MNAGRISAFVFALMLSGQALACAVCTSNDEVSSRAYLRSTVMMSLVPLAAIGGLVYFIYRKTQRGKTEE